MALGRRAIGSGEPLMAFLRRNWRSASIVVFAVVGLGISVFLTTEHYAKAEPFCPTVGPINCSSVLRSAYSVVPLTGSPSSGIPITVPGGIWFLVSGGLAVAMLLAAYQGRSEPAWLRPALALWSLAGLAFVLYLVYAEIVLIRSICLWCTAVHLLTLVTFLMALSLWQDGPDTAIVQPQRAHAAQVARRQPSGSHATRAPAGRPRTQATRHAARARTSRR